MNYLVFLFSLIMPLYALPLTILELIKKSSKKLSVFSFALAFAALAYTATPPFGWDITRHWAHMQSLEGKSLINIINDANFGYLILDSYIWLLNTFGLPKEFLPASVVFIGYFIKLSLFQKVKNDYLFNSSLQTIFLGLLVFWLPISFFGIASGLRGELGLVIVLSAAYELFFRNKLISFFIFSVIGFYFHPFMIAPIILTLVSYFFPYLARYGKQIVISSVILIFSSQIVNIIINYIVSIVSKLPFFSQTYFDTEGRFGAATAEHLNTNGIIATLIVPRIPTVIGILYLLVLKANRKNPLYLLLCLMSLYLGLFFSFYTLYSRMSAVFMHIFGIFIIIQYASDRSKKNKYFLIAFILSLILYSLINIYGAKNYISTTTSLLYKPFLFIAFNL